jgi:hypothetical protein
MPTQNEYEEILSNYESYQLIKMQFKARHGLELNTTTAQEIASSFRQARGYLEAAASADRSVRPLLVYYALLGYSRGLTLFLKPGIREAALSQRHGLSVEGWGAELAIKNGDVGNLRIKINAQGTLQQLIEATGHESYLRNNSSRPNFVVKMESPTAETEITLGELLARFPEVHRTFIRWRDDRCAVSIWPQEDAPGGGRKVRVDAPFGKEDWAGVFGDLPVAQEGGVLTGVVTPEAQANLTLSDTGGLWNVGSVVAMKKLTAGIELSKIATAFVVSYALGMLVRYYPSHWMGMLHGQRHDAALPTLLAALSQVTNDYPRYIVEFLERRPKEE